MKRENVKIGQRVAVKRAGRTVTISTIDRVIPDGFCHLENGWGAWPEQLRLLKKKPRERRYSMREIEEAWDHMHAVAILLPWKDSRTASDLRAALLALPERGEK